MNRGGPLRSAVPEDLKRDKNSRYREEPKPPKRDDLIEAPLRFKSLKEDGIQGPHLDTVTMKSFDSLLEENPFAISHDDIPGADDEEEEGGEGDA